MKKNSFTDYLAKKEEFEKAKQAGQEFIDSDHDGLSDFEEINLYGTNPHNADSDFDGVSDGHEVMLNRNPLGTGSLRDLFIPCAQNDYSPEILKPKRIIFHVVSLIAIKLVLVSFVVIYPLTAWLSPDVSVAEVQRVIKLTNELRKKVKLEALVENTKLDQAAWQKVQDMLVNQYFAHVNPSGQDLSYWVGKVGYKYSVAGENLAMGYATPEDVVAAWAKSPTHYENIIDGNFKETGVAIGDGRFKGADTVFMAQYFGRPLIVKSAPVKLITAPVVKNVKPATAKLVNTAKSVKGEKIYSDVPSSSTATIIKSGTIAIKGDSLADAKVLKAEVTLPPQTAAAAALVNNREIELTKVNETDQWTGSAIINSEDEKEISQPLVPATLTIEDNSGEISSYPLDWNEVTPVKTSIWERYLLFKNYPTAGMLPILIFGSFYFKALLVIFSLAALLNIFIKIKKQRPQLIINSIGLVLLLIILIIF